MTSFSFASVVRFMGVRFGFVILALAVCHMAGAKAQTSPAPPTTREQVSVTGSQDREFDFRSFRLLPSPTFGDRPGILFFIDPVSGNRYEASADDAPAPRILSTEVGTLDTQQIMSGREILRFVLGIQGSNVTLPEGLAKKSFIVHMNASGATFSHLDSTDDFGGVHVQSFNADNNYYLLWGIVSVKHLTLKLPPEARDLGNYVHTYIADDPENAYLWNSDKLEFTQTYASPTNLGFVPLKANFRASSVRYVYMALDEMYDPSRFDALDSFTHYTPAGFMGGSEPTNEIASFSPATSEITWGDDYSIQQWSGTQEVTSLLLDRQVKTWGQAFTKITGRFKNSIDFARSNNARWYLFSLKKGSGFVVVGSIIDTDDQGKPLPKPNAQPQPASVFASLVPNVLWSKLIQAGKDIYSDWVGKTTYHRVVAFAVTSEKPSKSTSAAFNLDKMFKTPDGLDGMLTMPDSDSKNIIVHDSDTDRGRGKPHQCYALVYFFKTVNQLDPIAVPNIDIATQLILAGFFTRQEMLR